MSSLSPSGPVSLGDVRALFDGSGNLDLSGGAIFRGGSVFVGGNLTARGSAAQLGHGWDGGVTTTPVVMGKPDAGGNFGGGSAFLSFLDASGEGVNKGTSIAFNTHNFGVDSAEKVRISANGHVGIGTSVPADKLDVRGNFTFTESSEHFARVSGFSALASDIGTHKLSFGGFPGASGVFKIVFFFSRASAGSQSNVFEECCVQWLNGQSPVVLNRMRFLSSGSLRDVQLRYFFSSELNIFTIEVVRTGGSMFSLRPFVTIHGQTPGYTFLFNDAAPVGNEISSYAGLNVTNGNVGIGTADAQEKVTILNGNVLLQSSNSYASGPEIFARWADSNNNKMIGMKYVYYSGSNQQATTTHSRIDFRSNNGIGLDFSDLSTNSVNVMSLLSNGNVGIGTTNPQALLHVNGTCIATVFNSPSGNFLSIRNQAGQGKIDLEGGTVKITAPDGFLVNGSSVSSDDRIKFDESRIDTAVPTILKLKPQTYRKTSTLEDASGGFIESGLIAQEVYYDAPELRHLVHVPSDASGIEVPPAGYGESSDPNVDPDYSNWGSTPAALNYTGLIPYLIRAVQEQEARLRDQEAKIAAQQQEIEQLRIATSGGSA